MDKRALIIPDCHIPYEDKQAYELMLLVAQNIKPKLDEIVILGDYADFYGVNSHGKSPAIVESMEDEIERVKARLRQLQELFPNANRVFIEGNHEHRLARYLQNKAPEIYNFLDTSRLLELEKFGFKFIPYSPDQKYKVLGSPLYARHEHLAGGLHCAHGTVTKASASVIFGHVHRIQESQIVSIDGEYYRGIASGWLGNKDHPVFNYVKTHHQWQLGFSVVTYTTEGIFHNQLVHIIPKGDKRYCLFEGYKYES